MGISIRRMFAGVEREEKVPDEVVRQGKPESMGADPVGEVNQSMKHGQTQFTVAAFAASLILACPPAMGGSLAFKLSTDSVRIKRVRYEPQLISESDIPPPTAGLAIQKSQAFSYVSSVDSLPPDREPGARMAQLATGLGAFPITQRITCPSITPSADSMTVILTNYAKCKNPGTSVFSKRDALYELWAATAYIDSETGSILKEIRTKLAHPGRIDTLEGGFWNFSSTLWDFYGRWMLHLADNFYYERVEKYPLAGTLKTSLKTVGRTNVGDRECFIVRFRRAAEDGEGIEKIYLVDVENRVTVQIKDEQTVLKLVLPQIQPSTEEP